MQFPTPFLSDYSVFQSPSLSSVFISHVSHWFRSCQLLVWLNINQWTVSQCCLPWQLFTVMAPSVCVCSCVFVCVFVTRAKALPLYTEMTQTWSPACMCVCVCVYVSLLLCGVKGVLHIFLSHGLSWDMWLCCVSLCLCVSACQEGNYRLSVRPGQIIEDLTHTHTLTHTQSMLQPLSLRLATLFTSSIA